MDGFTMSQDIKNKCGMRSSGTAQLSFDDVYIPRENLVGVQGKHLYDAQFRN